MILWGAFAPRYFPYCGIPADDVLSNFTTGFSSRLPPGEADTIPSTSSVRTARVQKANDSFPYMVTHYQTTCFPSQKTTLPSSLYQKIYHEIVLFNGFVLFLCWPNFLNIKKCFTDWITQGLAVWDSNGIQKFDFIPCLEGVAWKLSHWKRPWSKCSWKTKDDESGGGRTCQQEKT